MKLKIALIFTVVLALVVGCQPVSVIHLASVSDIQNLDFEEGFRYQDDILQLHVANGWVAWWSENDRRPEYKDAKVSLDPRRVHSGQHAQQWFTSWGKHTAGIYQIISPIEFGKTYQFSAWVQAWSSSGDDPNVSNGRYRMRIGIDPYGGTDPESADIVWSNDGNSVQPYDEYQQIAVRAQAKSDRITLWAWGQSEWALKHNDAYVDDMELSIVGEGPLPTQAPYTPAPSGEIDYARIEEIVRRVFREEWPTP